MPSFLLLLLFLSSPSFSQTQSLLDQAIQLIAKGNFSEALSILNQYKQSALSDSRAYFYAGVAQTELGRLSAGALELEEAVRRSPENREALVLLANVYARLKQNEASLETLEKVEKSPGMTGLGVAWLWLLSDSYFRLEQLDKTLKMLAMIESVSPQDGRVDLLRGQTVALKGDPDAAMASFQKAVKKSPTLAAAHFEIGKIQYQRNEMMDARTSFLETVRLDPKQIEAQLKLGQTLLALGRTVEAIEALLRVEREAPSLAQTYYALGSAYHKQGDAEKSAGYRRKFQETTRSQKAMEQQAQELSRLIAQGETQLDQGNERAAIELFLQAAGLDHENWDSRGYLVELYLNSPDWRLAYPHLVRMEKIDSDSVVGNFLMARYLYRSQEYGKALGYAEKVRLARPAHAELRNLMGGIFAALGQTEKAAVEFEAAVRLAPDRQDYVENLRKVRKPE